MKPWKKWISLLLSAVLLCGMLGTTPAAAKDADTMIFDLTVDGEETWMGIGNAAPYFAWKMQSTVTGQVQTAYQLVVTKEDGTVVWDSGKVESAVSTDIAYAGSPLESCTVYHWQVTVWDKDGREVTAQGQPFETAYLESDGLSDARWIKVGSDTTPLAAGESYTVEARMKLTGDAAGIICSATDASNMLMWQFNLADHNALYLRAHVFTNGNYQITEADLSAFGSVAQMREAFHDYRITVYPDRVETYIDGTLAHTLRRTGQIFGKAGLRAGSAGEFAQLSRFRVTRTAADGAQTTPYDFDFSDGVNPFSAGSVTDGVYTLTANAGAVFVGGSVPMFRCGFTPDDGKTIAKARLYTSGLGVYDVFLNGQRVGRLQPDGSTVYDELKPGWTDYNLRVLYHTYDVTPYLAEGANALLAEVANGWWAGRISGGAYGSHDLAFLAKLVVTYTDGSVSTLVTDESWQYSVDGPTRMADIFAGETYDAGREADFSDPKYDPAGWAPVAISTDFTGELTPFMGANIRLRPDLEQSVKQYTLFEGVEDNGTQYGEIHTVATPAPGEPVTVAPGQTLVVDLGQEMVGWPKFTVTGPKGAGLTIHFGEMLNDSGDTRRGNDGPKGSVYMANYRSAASTLQYLLKGDPAGETYASRLTHYGFRYLQITATAPVTLTALTGQVVTAQLTDTGSITTSNPEVNRLFLNTVWGQYGNYLSVPTDCPQRDERQGWTGDTQVFIGTAAYHANVTPFYNKWVQDANDNITRFGAYQGTIPTGMAGGVGCGWADAGVIVPYTLYQMYGNTRLLQSAYPSMKTYIANLGVNGAGYMTNMWGDWLAYDGSTPVVYCNIAYYCYVTHLMSRIAEILGETADIAYYEGLSQGGKTAFQSTYVKGDGDLTITSQCAYLMALTYDLLPDEHSVEVCTQALRQKIVDNNYTLSTGFLGTAILETGLSRAGLGDLAYDLLLQTGNPSWLYCVRNGATTVWERWNSYTSENGFGDVAMNSFNHYAYGCVAEWMYAYMAGIQSDPAAPGFRHFLLTPQVDTRSGSALPAGQENITHVQATYDSAYGVIRSGWNTDLEGVSLRYKWMVPANSSATVTLQAPEDASYVTVNGQTIRLRSVESLTVDGIRKATLTRQGADSALTLEAAAGSYNLLFTASAPSEETVETYGLPDPIEMEDPGTTVDPVLPGDMNGDGHLTVADVVLLRRAILASEGVAEHPAGEMNQDGSLTVADVVLLRRAVLGQS